MNKIYLKGLDGLRGIAAFLVVFGHIELIKKSINLYNVYEGGGNFLIYQGGKAVTFFFVLSGFLITYLLFNERESFSNISIKKFYLRRILRIWPVYYLLFIAGFILLPLGLFSNFNISNKIPIENYWNSFFYNLMLMPNFFTHSNPVAFQSWSIGVEEQFYLVWPVIISRTQSFKRLLIIMISIVIGIYLLRASLILNNLLDVNYSVLVTINKFFCSSRFDNMAIGGILAIFHYKYPEYKISRLLKTVILVLLAIIVIEGTRIGYGLDNLIASIVFAGIIYYVIKSKNHFILENTIFKLFGKISYGLYMYHVIAIYIGITIVLFYFPDWDGNGYLLNGLLYLFTVVMTFLISIFSYYFIEIKFLKIKETLNKISK